MKLEVFDLEGRLVSEVARGTYAAGTHNVSFDGSEVPSGTYLYRLTGPDFTQTRKMVLQR